MVFPEYESYDALGLAELVRRREVSPAELVDAAIERIEAENPVYNAVVHRLYESARARSKSGKFSGPFGGVPLLVKDHLSTIAGEPFECGSRFLAGYRAPAHSEIMRRWIEAGFIPVAKTSTPELALLPTTEPTFRGPTRNPWDPTRTTGGSSGGSATSVAARWVPVATGGDGGGSIRIPASCCGIFGLKPSRGRTPSGPEGESWEGFAIQHVLTRSVRDSAAVLDATSGDEVGAPYASPPKLRPFSSELEPVSRRMKIALSIKPPLAEREHPDCRAAVLDCADLLRDLGHEVVEAEIPVDARQFRRSMMIMLAGQTASEIRDMERLVGRKATSADFEVETWMVRALGEACSAGQYQLAVRDLQRAARRLCEAAEPYDAWLTPTLGSPPFRLGELGPKGVLEFFEKVAGRLELGRVAFASGVVERAAARFFTFIPYTPLANATGQPAMSVPLYWNAAGLPIGVQFSARFGDEATLFRLAAELERARPWAGRRPPSAANRRSG